MSDARDVAHDHARYAYEGRTNYGLVRAENGGIRMDEAHHSKGWEMGFHDGWDAAKADLPDREKLGEVLALVDGYDGCHQRVRDWEALPDWEKEAHPDEEPFSDREDAEFWNRRADAILALFRGEEPK